MAPLWLPVRSEQTPQYPTTRRDSVVDDYHGVEVADPYRWLEQLQSLETIDWVQAQTALTRDVLQRVPIRDELSRGIRTAFEYPRTNPPQREAGRLFFTSTNGLEQQPIFYLQPEERSRPRPIIDPNIASPDGSSAYRDFVVSPDGRLVAYSVSRGGADE